MRRLTQSHWFGARLTIPGWGGQLTGGQAGVGQKITPFLWFDRQALEAANYYVSLFDDSRIVNVTRFGSDGHRDRPEGGVATVTFRLAGFELTALNGGPFHRFTEAFSLVLNCESQAEIDQAWVRLSEGGTRGECGWLRDRFGLYWQVVPVELNRMLSDPDGRRVQRVMDALLEMKKLDLERLRQAYELR